MAWRVHLTNQAIQHVDILSGKTTVVAVWTQRDRVAYFDLDSGASLQEQTYRAAGFDNRQGEKWQEYLATLVAPNGLPLPLVRTAQATIHTSDDGRLRLYQISSDQLFVALDGKELPLEISGAPGFRALALDRFMGVVAALDDKGKLHLYQQYIRVGAFDLKLPMGVDSKPLVAVANGGVAVFASNGHEIVQADSSGKVRKRLEVHYFIGRLDCSPDGRLLTTSDVETGVIRVYDGAELIPLYQRHAFDLMQAAAQLQLIADLPPYSIAPSALAVDNQGHVAFAMSGVVCLTHLRHMDALPRPQPLL
jgi:hypothetical protein